MILLQHIKTHLFFQFNQNPCIKLLWKCYNHWINDGTELNFHLLGDPICERYVKKSFFYSINAL